MMELIKWKIVWIFLLVSVIGRAQTHRVSGSIISAETENPMDESMIFIRSLDLQVLADSSGYFQLQLPKGTYILEAFSMGMESISKEILVDRDLLVNFYMQPFSESLDEVEVVDQGRRTTGIARLKSIDGFGIYEAKKNEIILLDDFAANKVTNNARQVFAKVPGLNIWESDYAGLQLDIAARGLGPSRTANFNTRQNGYDMSADALGYPESYCGIHSLVWEALKKIWIIMVITNTEQGMAGEIIPVSIPT